MVVIRHFIIVVVSDCIFYEAKSNFSVNISIIILLKEGTIRFLHPNSLSQFSI